MVRVAVVVLSLVLALPLAACGGGGADDGPRTAEVQFGDPGDGNLGFATQSTLIVREGLLDHDLIRVLRHELMHVAGLNGHPTTTDPCYANGNIAFWPEEPCQSDLELMAKNLPNAPIRLIVTTPDLMAQTLDAAGFWNAALGRQAFLVQAGY